MKTKTVKPRAATKPRPIAKLWQLRLYVVDSTPKSLAAMANLKQFCETYLKGIYRISVIDLLKRPQLAKGDQILLKIWRHSGDLGTTRYLSVDNTKKDTEQK